MNEGIHVAIKAEELGNFLGLPITNSLLMGWIVVFTVVLIAMILKKKISMNPGKFQLAAEELFTGYRAFIEENLDGTRATAMKFFPLLMTLVLFIFVGNFLEFVPGVESIVYKHDGHEIPLLRSMNTDLNATLALAIIVFFIIEITGIRKFGLSYFSRFFNFHSVIGFFVGIIELVSEFVRLVSFSFRLFGNIFAGSVMIAVITYFVPVILPAPFMLFEMFVAVVQALIFSLLTLFFIKMAITESH
jgi:F-type H+-transporting ATPase subunit a